MANLKNKLKAPLVKPAETVIYPKNKTIFFFVTLALSFAVNFVIYLLTLAPTVTFEDSGEFISAAYNLGVPHEPGYPLFTMLGKLFSYLPIGTIAYRVNLMSAFFTALAGMLVFYATVLIIENTFLKTSFWQNARAGSLNLLKYSVALCSCLLFGLAYTSWEQAVITEVYGLNSLFVSLFILLTLLLGRQETLSQKKKYCYILCFSLGLTLTNHTTSLMLIPLFGVYLFLTERGLLLDVKMLLKSIMFFVLGLTPLLYLPIAALRKPIVNWGNPATLKDFIWTITRHQYQDTGPQQTLETFLPQFMVYVKELLIKQWLPIVLASAIFGAIMLFRRNKPYFLFSLSFLFFSMPVTTWMTNFDVTTPSVAFEQKALVSVFYIPAYLFLAILAGIGMFYLVSLVKIRKTAICAAVALVLPLATAAGAIAKNYSALNMHAYYFAQDYADNIFNSLPKNSLLFVNWDPFTFPLMYYQFVEHKRPDILVLDQLLLKRSWYVQWLKDHYPAFVKPSESAVKAFLQAVAPFENKAPYNGEIIQQCYIGMINAFIDSKISRGNSVYFAYIPEADILRNYHLEPIFSAYKYTQNTQPDTTVNASVIKLAGFTDKNANRDRMADYIRGYYGNLYGLRAMQCATLGNMVKAKEYFTTARKLFDDTSQQAAFIDRQILKIK
ncbi:MAG: DUF2723 domain-containing protein [Chitinivibrionales bacterium]|nr:DUF2723 domain-containing protein [Chitinivibrionales bacterium]